MKSENWPPAVGVKFVERRFKLPGYGDLMSMIEVVGECLGDYYFINWLVNEDSESGEDIERRRHGRIEPSGLRVAVDVPYELYQKMLAEVLGFLEVEKDLDSIKSLHEHVLTVDPKDKSKVTVRFKRRAWSPYLFGFYLHPSGELRVTKTENNIVLTGERARDGHKRPPRKAARAAYSIASEHFAGCLHSDNHTQCELELAPQDAPK
ncbi:MAG: hypothetical protein WBL19_02060 [Minisyncoccia bacterium]